MAINQNSKPSFLVLLSLLGLLSRSGVSALPHPSQNELFNATQFPRDTEDFLVVRDVDLHRRGANTCSDLSVEQAQRMPGWDKLEKYAKDTWGDGSWNIVTNPKDYPNTWASACIDDAPVKITPKGKPQCSTNTVTLKGDTDGTSGKFTVGVTTGQKTDSSWTVTRNSEFGTEASFGVSFEIPGIFDAEASFSASTSFTNTHGNTFTTTTDNQQTSNVQGDTKLGATCGAHIDTKTCNQQGEGKIRIAATGYVWFNYDSAVAPKSDPKGDKHYKWAAKIDDVLTLDERTSWMDFDGSISGESKGQFHLFCNGPDGKPLPVSPSGGPGSKEKAAPASKNPASKPTSKPAPKPAPKDAPGKPASKDAPEKPASKDTPGKPSSKDTPGKPSSKDTPGKPSSKDAPGKPAPKPTPKPAPSKSAPKHAPKPTPSPDDKEGKK